MATAIGSSWTKLVEYASTDTYTVTYRLYAKYSATSITDNTHTIQLKWTTQKTSGGTGVYDNNSCTPKVTNISNGAPNSWTGTAFTIVQGSAVTETDRTTSSDIVVTHASNGTYSATWSWSLSHVYEGGSKSGTVQVTLPTIPRASTFTLSSNSISTAGTTTATITRADAGFTHKITTVYNNTTYYLLGTSSAASSTYPTASLSIPTALRTAMKSANAKSASLTLTLTTYSSSSVIGTATTSLTITAPTATVSMSASSVNCNANITWTLANTDTTACTYTVTRKYSSVTYTDQTKGTTTSYAGANANFQTIMSSSTSATVTTTVTTYVGTTTVGTATATYTVKVPTGTYYWNVANGTTTYQGGKQAGKSIAGLEHVTQTFTLSSQGTNNSSSVASWDVTCSRTDISLSVTKSSNTITVVTGTLPGSASNYTFTLTCTINDTRGTTKSVTTNNITATGYKKPTVSGSATRVNSSGQADSTGTYAKLNATASATTATMSSVTIKYGASTAASGTSSASINAYGGSFALTSAYSFTVTATDSFGQTTTITLQLPVASYEFNLYPGGGAAFGMVASANRVDSAYNGFFIHQSSGNTGLFSVENSNYRIGLSIGSGGANRGIYDYNTSSDNVANSGVGAWILYLNNQNKVQIPHSLNVNDLTINNSALDIYYISRRVAYFGETSATGNTDGWWKVASGSFSGYGNTNLVWLVMDNYSHGEYGIIGIQLRGNSSTGTVAVWANSWLVRNSAYGVGDFMVVTDDNQWTIYGYRNRGYGRRSIVQLLQNSINGAVNDTVTYYDGVFYGSTAPTGDVVSTSTDSSIVSNATTATNATNATNVTVTNTQPTSATNYYINFGTATSGNLPSRANAAFIYRMLQGSADTEGYMGLVLGRNIAVGSANNGYGFLRLYGHGTYYYNIYPSTTANTANHTLYTPNISGTIAIRDATVTGTLTNGSWVTIAYPTGYSQTTCHVTGWDVDYNGNYRTGDGLENSATTSRVLISLESDGIKVYTGSSTYNTKTIRVFLSLNA